MNRSELAGTLRARPATRSVMAAVRRALFGLAAALTLSLAVLPALADDDGPPPPPDANAQAAAAQTTIAVLGLVVGVAVYYGVQRHAVLDSGKHPPTWQNTMNRTAVALAFGSAVVVWIVCAALSRPAHHPAAPTASAAPSAPRNPM